MNKIQINAISNYLFRFWQIISLYLFIPVYLKLLDIESYGLIAFFTSIVAVISIADAGFSAAFSRKIAENGPSKRSYLLFISLEKVLSGILIIGSVIAIFFSKNISDGWISSAKSNMSNEIQVLCISLMIVCSMILVQTNFYISGLMGLQKQIHANLLNTISSFVRQGLVIIPLYFNPSVVIYFVWQLVFSFVFLFISRFILLKSFKKRNFKFFFSAKAIKGVIRFASGMLLLSIITVINTQLDKLVVSNTESLETFSYYSLAMTLGQLPILIVSPLVLAMYPMLISLPTGPEKDRFYEGMVFLSTVFASLIAGGLFFYSENVLHIWLGGANISTYSSILLKIAALSNLFLALQIPPFYLSMGFGHSATNIKLGIVCVLLYIPTQFIVVKNFGVLGAPWPFLILNIIAFIYLTIVINKKFYGKELKIFIFKCLLIPSCVVIALTYFISVTCQLINLSNTMTIIIGILNGLLLLIFSKRFYEKNFSLLKIG